MQRETAYFTNNEGETVAISGDAGAVDTVLIALQSAANARFDDRAATWHTGFYDCKGKGVTVP